MGPFLLPFLERQVRRSIQKKGVDTRYVNTSAGPIHVYDAKGNGNLPPIVVLHGIAASGTGFAPFFMQLRAHTKRIIVPDYPGHGFSRDPTVHLDADALFSAVRGALDSLLGEKECILVGNSLGGVVALDYALHGKAKPRALILTSPAGAPSTDAEFAGIKDAFGFKNRREALAFSARVYHRIPPFVYVIAHELPANVRRRAVQDLFGSAGSGEIVPPALVSALTLPILFMWGESERLLPDSHLEWWRKALPKEAVIERPYAMGHCPHLDAPERLAARIVSFLEKAA
jgi:pimeloyl-ACP methyl ester carboxylesterase